MPRWNVGCVLSATLTLQKDCPMVFLIDFDQLCKNGTAHGLYSGVWNKAIDTCILYTKFGGKWIKTHGLVWHQL